MTNNGRITKLVAALFFTSTVAFAHGERTVDITGTYELVTKIDNTEKKFIKTFSKINDNLFISSLTLYSNDLKRGVIKTTTFEKDLKYKHIGNKKFCVMDIEGRILKDGTSCFLYSKKKGIRMLNQEDTVWLKPVK